MNNMNMGGMNMGGMSAANMNMAAAANMANSMNMNSMNMNMAAHRAGMLGGAGGAGGGGAGGAFGNQLSAMGASDDLAAALYFNDLQNPAARMGLLGQRDPFMAAAAQGSHLGGLGGGNPFGDYSRLAQNPYAGLAGFPNAGAQGGANSRRAQLLALMDMENGLQMQQPDASKANGGGANDGGGWRGGQAPRGNDLADNQPTQIPDPPMDIPTFSTASTPAVLPLPPVIEEGAAAHFSQRSHIPLGIDEDNNWLTEFQVRVFNCLHL